MRSLVISICILALILGGMFWYYSLLSDLDEQMQTMLSDLDTQIKEDKWEEATKTAEKINKEWEEKTRWLSCLIEHDEIDNIMITVASLEKFTKYKEEPELMSELSKLQKLISHIPRKEKLIPENLF